MKNYLEEGDKVEGDWMVRNPEIINRVLDLAGEQMACQDDTYYLGVQNALRWVLCGTPIKPLPKEYQ